MTKCPVTICHKRLLKDQNLTSTQHRHQDDATGPDVCRLGVVLRLDQDLRSDVGLRAAPTLQQTLLALKNRFDRFKLMSFEQQVKNSSLFIPAIKLFTSVINKVSLCHCLFYPSLLFLG